MSDSTPPQPEAKFWEALPQIVGRLKNEFLLATLAIFILVIAVGEGNVSISGDVQGGLTIVQVRDGAVAANGSTALGREAMQTQVEGHLRGDVLGPHATKTETHYHGAGTQSLTPNLQFPTFGPALPLGR